MGDAGTEARALLAGLPQRHVDAAVEVCAKEGRVVIPAGSPGDLDRAAAGMDVLLMISGEDAVPAVTWRATFLRRVAGDQESDPPDLLPPTWLEERLAAAATRDPAVDRDEDDEDDDRGPQSFFEVERLEPLPKQDWIFANELVRKQERGGRAFFPRAPRLIRPPA